MNSGLKDFYLDKAPFKMHLNGKKKLLSNSCTFYIKRLCCTQIGDIIFENIIYTPIHTIL